MTNTQIEVITSVQRRRRWSAAEKEQLVAASLEPGASVSALARAAGLDPSQLYGWRRQLCGRTQPAAAFAAVQVAAAPQPAVAAGSGVIEIELAGGTRLRISGGVDAAVLTATLGALAAGGRRR